MPSPKFWVGRHVLLYSGTKSVTQNIRGFIEKRMRAAQRVLRSHMRLSKLVESDWYRLTRVRVGNLRLWSRMQLFSSSEVALSGFDKTWNLNVHAFDDCC